MNLSVNGLSGFSVFSQRFGTAGMLKSTQDKLERQQKAQSQIKFFENQKENLKNMQCDSIEDIARKLEMFHSYEDQIAAVKKQYNNEQMFHTMDEARERGEKIEELAEDYAPKTEEERKEEMVEEALGIEEKGGLTESMEEVQEITEEMVEELATENVELLDEAMTAESEVLAETAVLPPEEVKYKKIDILI
ncbi:MAG: hypothetical protein IKY94_10490 [Lachnospiraceae bacterium]|nr:hypothetical protein [Lachnospiraceae bacterium]